jgi:hypothetical protein
MLAKPFWFGELLLAAARCLRWWLRITFRVALGRENSTTPKGWALNLAPGISYRTSFYADRKQDPALYGLVVRYNAGSSAKVNCPCNVFVRMKSGNIAGLFAA